MDKQTAVVLGATGLIGQNVVSLLLKNENFSFIRLLVRKPIEVTDIKIETLLTDFNDLNDLEKNIGKSDCLLCCIGTTLQTVKGNKAAYRKIDYDIIVNAARLSASAGFKQFVVVSSVGANYRSSNFYLKLKGEIERDISALPFEGIHIFRPSILLGKRKQFRLFEILGQEFMHIFSFLFVGHFTRYKGIYARDVAKAMVTVASSQIRGVHIYEHDHIADVLSGANIG
jgi:uncharacterized protein YbjT (DUF2867 family)